MNILGIDFEDWYHPELIKKNIKDEKHGGTEELENLVLQKIKGNKEYGATHLIN